jgi:molybdenum cofactor guanylyltransferase
MTGNPPPPGLILAGGRSSRMGANKALLPRGSDRVIGHVIRRFGAQVADLAINAPASFPGHETIAHVEDDPPGQLGPLAGILTGMRHHARRHPQSTHFVTAPCDSPFLPLDLVARLVDARPDERTIVIAASSDRRHPVFGLWPVALASDLQHWLLSEDNRRINAFLTHHHVVTVDFPTVSTSHGELDPFLNINTPEDLAGAEAFADMLA